MNCGKENIRTLRNRDLFQLMAGILVLSMLLLFSREISFFIILLLDWAIDECTKDGRKLLFNEPFNAGSTFHECMDERGIRKLHRVEMALYPKSKESPR